MDRMREGEAQKIRLGVSACQLGQQVRYDGGHKRGPFLTETLGPFVGDLVVYHTAQKFAVLTHSPSHDATLGRLVAAAGAARIGTRLADYGALLMQALSVRATRARHANVLQHLAGFFKPRPGDTHARL
jgi:hypothetical protein